MKKTIVLATNSVGKLNELKTILANVNWINNNSDVANDNDSNDDSNVTDNGNNKSPIDHEFKNKCNITIISQQELATTFPSPIPPCIESGLTFVENAIIKARHVCSYTADKFAAIADDSGLVVDALGGAPGIVSARYATVMNECASECSDAIRVIKSASDSDNLNKLLRNLKNITFERRSARFYCVMVYLRCISDPAPIITQGTWEGKILTAPQGENGFGYDPVFWVPNYNCAAAELPPNIKNQISHRAQAFKELVEKLHSELC